MGQTPSSFVAQAVTIGVNENTRDLGTPEYDQDHYEEEYDEDLEEWVVVE